MDKFKKYIKYVLWIILFYLFTHILIFIGLNIDYKPISNDFDLPKEITIKKAEATEVNGRIYGEILNSENENLNGEYIKINLYNKEHKLVETKYIEIDIENTKTATNFKLHFKSNNIKYYNIEIVKEK